MIVWIDLDVLRVLLQFWAKWGEKVKGESHSHTNLVLNDGSICISSPPPIEICLVWSCSLDAIKGSWSVKNTDSVTSRGLFVVTPTGPGRWSLSMVECVCRGYLTLCFSYCFSCCFQSIHSCTTFCLSVAFSYHTVNLSRWVGVSESDNIFAC